MCRVQKDTEAQKARSPNAENANKIINQHLNLEGVIVRFVYNSLRVDKLVRGWPCMHCAQSISFTLEHSAAAAAAAAQQQQQQQQRAQQQTRFEDTKGYVSMSSS